MADTSAPLSKSGSVSDQNKQLASRKTKWGPDLTQDAFVRKGRLLAYQTRVDQIAKLIGMRDPETEAGQDVDMESRDANQESSHYEIDAEELEKLKLERREIIGEILKLNPSYKAPSDYVPLLKEAQVPLPIKDYPGYNFLGLIYGSGSDTLKRLEKETGAKIQVFGKKKDCPEKVEITSDAKKNQDDYEELYALISADTYDKVDAAVSLVELLVTPVSASGSTLSVSNTPIMGQSSEPPSGLPKAAGEGVMQQLVRPQQIFQGQFQYNSPAPGLSHPAQLLGSQMTPGGMVPTVSTSPLMSDPSPFPSAPQSQGQFPMQPYISDSHSFGQTGPPRYPPVVAPPTFPSQPNIANVLHQFSGSQPTPIGMSSLVRPLVTSLPQPAPGHPIRSQLNQDGSSAGWPRPPVPTPNSTMVGPSASAQGQQNTAFGMAQTVPLHPRPPAFLLPSNVNQGAATNTYIAPSPQVRSYSASSQGPSVATLPTHPLPNLAVQSPLIRGPVSASQNPAYRPGAVPLPRASAPLPPLNQSSFLPVRPVTGMPSGMQFPHSGDFVFQPQLPNSAAQIHPWPGSATHNNPPLRPTMQKPFDIRAPSLPPDFPKQPHRPFPHGTFRTHAEDHYDRFRPQFDEWNPSDVYSQPRFPPFSNENFGMRNAPLSRMGEMSMDRSYPMANMHGSFLSRPGNDYLPLPRPGRNPLNINPSGPPTYRHTRGQLTYDPFSPTTGSAVHQQQQVTADAKTKNQEKNDPEYEDLMASVGVK